MRSKVNQLAETVNRLKIAGDLVTDFEPLPKQYPFFDAMAKYKEIIFSAGNDCGKTYIGLMADAYWTIPEMDINNQPTGYALIRRFGKHVRIPPDGIRGWISCWSEKVQQGEIQHLVDKIFGPYIVNRKKQGGVDLYIETKGGRIDFRWQQMGVESYQSDKLHFAHLDEPHSPSIYKETANRLNKWGGSMWNTITPARGKTEDNPTIIRNLMWLRENKVIPWQKNPKTRPLLTVMHMSIKDNPYHNWQEIEERNAGMDDMERAAREEGLFIMYDERAAFNTDMITKLKDYLIENPNSYIPYYGTLEYDPTETNLDFKVKFESTVADYPDKPDFADKFIVKIWEHPIKIAMDYRPTYFIGVDAAEGKKGGDYTAIYVKRGDTGAIVASLHGYLDEVELAKQIWMLGYYYCDMDFSPALVAIETLKEGKVAMQLLLTGVDSLYGMNFPPYDWNKLYREPTMDDLKAGIHIPSEELGYHTGAGKREFLIKEMRLSLFNAYRHLEDAKVVLIPDIAWLEEAENFIRDKTGKYGAAVGWNDDRLFASALCDMALKQGMYTLLSEPAYVSDSIFSVKDGEIYINIANAKPKVERLVVYL